MAQESGTLSLVFFYLETVGAKSVHLRHETTTRYSLKATTKISPHSRNKNVPVLRSQNTQNTRTPLKTGSEQSLCYFLLDSGTLIHFRWINLKLALSQHNNQGRFTYSMTRKGPKPEKFCFCVTGGVTFCQYERVILLPFRRISFRRGPFLPI